MAIAIVGLDLAKHVFQVHAVDEAGRAILRRQLRRAGVEAFFKTLPPCTHCCTGRLGGRPRVGWCGGEPSIVEGRLPCRSKPTATAGITFRSSDTGSPTGQRTLRACVPGVA